MNRDIAHVAWDGSVETRTANLHIDPESIEVEVPRIVAFGIERRWMAVTDGQCRCGAYLVLANRETRRGWKKMGQQVWDGLVQHLEGCPAVAIPTLQWIQKNRRLAI